MRYTREVSITSSKSTYQAFMKARIQWRSRALLEISSDISQTDNVDSFGGQFIHGDIDMLRVHRTRAFANEDSLEAKLDRVQTGHFDAVIRGQADHHHRLDPVLVENLGKRGDFIVIVVSKSTV